VKVGGVQSQGEHSLGDAFMGAVEEPTSQTSNPWVVTLQLNGRPVEFCIDTGAEVTVISDNGPQYDSEAYATFAKDYQFHHITSSPYFPQSNGEAERAVGTVKNLLKKSDDPYLALLSYRATPLQNGYSPSELLMCRILRTTVPSTRSQRVPKVPDAVSLRAKDERLKSRQKLNFDSHHGARELPPLAPGDTVWVPYCESEGSAGKEVVSHS